MSGRPGRDRGDWVTLFPGVRVSRGWMETNTPQLLVDWRQATTDDKRRAIAGLIVRVAASRERARASDQSWLTSLERIDPRLARDPDWMALVMAIEHAAASGYDVEALLPALARTPPLPERHPARELHWRLLDACPAAVHSTPDDPPEPAHRINGA